MERRILFTPIGPLAGVLVQAADAGRGGHPDEFALDRDAVKDVVQQAAGQIGEVLKVAAGEPADPPEGADPQVAGFWSTAMPITTRFARPSFGLIDPGHLAVLDQDKTVFGARPDALPSTATQKTFSSGMPFAVVKFSQRVIESAASLRQTKSKQKAKAKVKRQK